MSDLIRRDEAIQVINDLLDIYVPNESQYDSGAEDNCKKIIALIKSIPSAEPKVGAWIDDEEYNTEYGYYFAHCSECGYQMDVHENRGYHNFCPNCGAKMERSE